MRIQDQRSLTIDWMLPADLEKPGIKLAGVSAYGEPELLTLHIYVIQSLCCGTTKLIEVQRVRTTWRFQSLAYAAKLIVRCVQCCQRRINSHPEGDKLMLLFFQPSFDGFSLYRRRRRGKLR